MIEVENNKYELLKNYKEGFNLEEFQNLYTEYFENYDYILGDYAYNKLRLKGFYNKDNASVNETNNYENIDNYIQEYCAYDCRYFILKRIAN